MKTKKIMCILMVLFIFNFIPVYAANTYDDGTLIIDTQWDITVGKGLADEITALNATVSEIITLNISAGEITDDDITWIRKNLSGLVTLNINNNATFTTEVIDSKDVMVFPIRAFSAVSGRNADENGVLNNLITIIIDIDDSAVIHLAEENFSFLNSLELIRIDEARDFSGKSVFWHCGSLTDVTMNNLAKMSYTSRNIGAFEDCNSLASISFPSLINVGYGAFSGCNLEIIDLPVATTFGKFVFASNTNMVSVLLPEALTFESDAFFSCINLESVNLPKVVSMGGEAFESCRKLETVNLPLVTTLGVGAFLNCTNLKTIILPEINEIGNGMFNNCTSITVIETPKLQTIGNFAFQSSHAFTWKLGDTPPNVSALTNNPKFVTFHELNNSKVSVADTLAYTNFNDGDTSDDLWYGWKVISSVNHPPTVTNPLSDIDSVTENIEITVDLSNVFTDVDAGDSVTLSTDKGSIDGTNLKYMPLAGDVIGTTITITITGTDTNSASVDDVFVINSVLTDPTPINLTEVAVSTDYGKINFESKTDTAGTLYVLAILISDTNLVNAEYVIANGSRNGRIAGEFRAGVERKEEGEYNVYFVVEDHEGRRSDLIKIENVVVPDRLTFTYVKENVTSYGGNDGKITVAANGAGTYEYKISNDYQDSPIFSSLSAGTYRVVVREESNNDNISLGMSVIISQPSQPVVDDTTTKDKDPVVRTTVPIVKKTPLEKELEKELKKDDEDRAVLNAKLSTDKSGKATLAIPKGFAGKKIELKIETENVNVVIKGDMFKGDEKDVKLIIKPKNKEELGLSKEDKKLIGNLPIFDISINIDNKKVNWSSDKNIHIEFPLKIAGKKSYKFVAVYINDEGKVELLRKSIFNGNSIQFSTKHLSYYSVMYIDKTFIDTNNHWAKEAVEALASRGITSGTSETTFSPNNIITRAEFVTLVVQYFGLETEDKVGFIDVDEKMYYAKSVETAKSLELLPTIYGEEFKPNEAITREDVMTILYNALVVTKNDIFEDKMITMDNFVDKNDLVSYAVKGAGYFVSRDIVHGYDNKLNPNGTSTRAEVAQLLYSILNGSTK